MNAEKIQLLPLKKEDFMRPAPIGYLSGGDQGGTVHGSDP